MKRSKKLAKLAVKRETLRILQDVELSRAPAGVDFTFTCKENCPGTFVAPRPPGG
jgi:hypothetical protein